MDNGIETYQEIFGSYGTVTFVRSSPGYFGYCVYAGDYVPIDTIMSELNGIKSY